jgi:hypothetical protein
MAGSGLKLVVAVACLVSAFSLGAASASAASFKSSSRLYPVFFTASDFTATADVFTFHGYVLHCEGTTFKGTLSAASAEFEGTPQYHCGAEDSSTHASVKIESFSIGCNYRLGGLSFISTGHYEGTVTLPSGCKDKLVLGTSPTQCKITVEGSGTGLSGVKLTDVSASELELKFGVKGMGYTNESCPGQFDASYINGEYTGTLKGSGMVVEP